jgi:hypothetical protein
MDCNTLLPLSAFRNQIYACFGTAKNALFDVCDALLTGTQAHSFVELSLAPAFARRWSSLYKAVQDAKIDRDALRHAFAAQVTAPADGKRLVLGIDASSIARPQSQTARDRTYVHASNLPEGSVPTVAGWQFSALTVLPEEPGSWTYVLDNLRVESAKTQGEVAAQQLTEIIPLLPVRPLLLGDGYYGGVTFLKQVETVACDKLLRLTKNRNLYRPAPPPTGKRGGPQKDGARFQPQNPATHAPPDATWSGTDASGKEVTVSVWHNLHFKAARQITVSVIRVERHHATDSKRDPRQSWFVWQGQELPPLCEIALLYARRYSQEHGYRVDKQNLLWETPRLRTPEQFQVWTDVVACVRNQLCLARCLAQVRRQPWERTARERTPQQVRRAMPGILAQLGTPARLPQPRGKSPGRSKGVKVKPALRFKTIFKDTSKVSK